jgi:hypothetical protein
MTYKYTAIIIEPRKHKALSFVLNNVCECLSEEWKIILFYGTNNYEYSKNIIDELNEKFKSPFTEINGNRINMVGLNVDNLNLKTYSQLLATKSLIYDYIDTEYFIVFQTDSMILKSNSHLINEYINSDIDYVGAPWLICNYPPTQNRNFIGNGGFSLRRTSKMLEIIEKYQWNEHSRDWEWPEDLFFTDNYSNITTIKPDYEKAKLFCVDEIFSPVSFAVHSCWKHTHYPQLVALYPEIENLKNLQSVEE